MNILSINENSSMNYLIDTVLSNKYTVISATDVFKGLYILKHKSDIALIIVDVDYQTNEVIDFIHHTRSSSLFKRPIIVLSSKHNSIIVKKLMEEGRINTYFFKPFDPVDLQQIINQQIVSTYTYSQSTS